MILNALFLGTALTFSLGQLGRISFFHQEANLYLYEIFIAFSLLLLFVRYRFEPLHLFREPFRPVFLLLAYLSISFLWGFNHFSLLENLVSLLYILRFAFYMLYMVYLSYYLWQHDNNKWFLKRSLVVSYLMTLIFAVVQYLFYPNLRNLSYAGWDPHLFRVFGTFFEPVIFATVLGIFLLYAMLDVEFIRASRVKITSMTLTLLLFILTFSRGSYTALLLTELGLLFKQYMKVVVVGLVFFILGLFLIPKPFGEGVNLFRTSTIDSRAENYKEAFAIWQKHRWVGVGFDRIRYVKEQSNLLENTEDHSGASFHSSFLIILVAGGVAGLLLYGVFLWSLANLSWYALTVVTFLSLASLTDNILLHAFILFLVSVTIPLSVNRFDTSP